MKCLAINTAGKILSIAIVEDDNLLYLFEEEERRGQGNNLIGYIEKALNEVKLEVADIDLMAVVTGPGSFTGIRVGISAMRGYSLATKIPVIGISAFDMFEDIEIGKINIIAIESWREELYFAFKDEKGKDIVDAVNISPNNILSYLENNDLFGKEFVISGDAGEKLRDVLPNAEFIDCSNINSFNVAKIAIDKKIKVEVIEKPTPYYLRPADISESTKAVKRTIVE